MLSYSPAVGSRSRFWQYGLTKMDPAGEEFVRSAIAHQGALLGHQASQLSSTAQEVETLMAQVAELSGRFRELQQEVLSSSASAAPLPLSHRDHEPELHANNPPLYDGDPNSCRAFLSQCSLVFALQPRRYATERLKIAYVITLLTGRAREWETAVWEAGAFFCNDFEEFRCEMTRLFDHSVRGDEAASKLARLRQGGRSVTEYAIQFKTLAASCDWNEGGAAMFRERLNFEIQDEIATHELPQDLEGFINLATRVEGYLRLAPR